MKHIFFVAETKGTMSSLELRPIEQAKIKCARKLFKQLSNGKVVYHDVDSYENLLNVMKDLANQGMTMICVTHEMGFAREVADKVVFMAKGMILEEGTPEEIFTNPKTPEARQFLKSVL